jgi:hypothetical protein
MDPAKRAPEGCVGQIPANYRRSNIMKKLLAAAALGLALATPAAAGDLGAPSTAPNPVKPSVAATAFFTVVAVALSPTIVGAIAWMATGGAAMYAVDKSNL